MAYRPIYSTRFILGRVSTAGTPQLTYTVPAGRVAVIDCMTAVKSIAATPTQVSFAIDPTGAGGPISLWWVNMPGTTVIENALWQGRCVLDAGDQIQVTRSGAASDAAVSVSGWLLTAP